MRYYYTYILTSRSGVLYVGVTNDLERRMFEHKTKRVPGFTAKYNVSRLAWYETFHDVWQAIGAEKRIKGYSRAKKIALIIDKNPTWTDLSAEWPALLDSLQRNLSSRQPQEDLDAEGRLGVSSDEDATLRPEIPRRTSE